MIAPSTSRPHPAAQVIDPYANHHGPQHQQHYRMMPRALLQARYRRSAKPATP